MAFVLAADDKGPRILPMKNNRGLKSERYHAHARTISSAVNLASIAM